MAPGYRASRSPDGSWTIHDVPIFASNRLRRVEVTREWQERAVTKATLRANEVGHLPPIHEHHTGEGQPLRNLGLFRPTRVGTLKVVEDGDDGAPVVREAAATYADFVGVPDEAYQRIKRGELPYVSVEADLARCEIHGLAMLPNAPAIKTPPVRISHEEEATAVVAYSAEGGSVRTTMRFGAVMDDPKKADDPPAPKADAAPADPKAPPAMPEKPEGAEKPAEGAKPEGEAPAAPEAPAADAKQMTLLLGRMAQLESAVAALTAAAQMSRPAETPVNPGAAPAPAPFQATSTTATATAAPKADTFSVSAQEWGAFQARLDAMEADAKARSVADARTAKVREVADGLARDGFAVTPDMESALAKMAADKGIDALVGYAEGIRKHGRKVPPSDIAGALAPVEDPEMLSAFGACSPEVRAAADRYAAQHEALNGASSLKKVDFVRALLRADRLIKE